MSDTLATLRQALLPLALQLGYTDVSVGASINKFGRNYWASAHGQFCITPLANIIDHDTAESALHAGMEVLYAEMGCSASL